MKKTLNLPLSTLNYYYIRTQMKKSDIFPMPKFFEVYIHPVEDEELILSLEKSLAVLDTLDLKEMEALGDKVYAPGKWTIKDIFQHMIDTERVQAYRAMRLARNDKTELPGFEENLFAKHTNLSAKTLRELLDEFILLRKVDLMMFENFSDEMLQRVGICNKVEITPLALGFVLVGHQQHHLNVIRERYLSIVGG